MERSAGQTRQGAQRPNPYGSPYQAQPGSYGSPYQAQRSAPPRYPRRRGRRKLPTVLVVLVLLVAAGLLIKAVSVSRREAAPRSSPEQSSAVLAATTPVLLTPTETPLPSPQPGIPHLELRYLLGQLTGDMAESFRLLYDCAMDFRERCDFDAPLTREQVRTLYNLLCYECPEVLQLDRERGYTMWSSGGSPLVTGVSLYYSLNEDEYLARRAQCQAVADRVAADTAGMSEAERERYAYDYLISACRYDKDAVAAGTAYGALIGCAAKCDGISLAMKWLAEELGLSCLVISGDGDDPVGHAWNVIRTDGVFRDLDVTSDIDPEGEPRRYYGAYNVSADWLRREYRLDSEYDGLSIPSTASMDGSYHVLNGSFVYRGEDWAARLEGLVDRAAERGEAELLLQFEDAAEFQLFRDAINDALRARLNRRNMAASFSTATLPDKHVARVTLTLS